MTKKWSNITTIAVLLGITSQYNNNSSQAAEECASCVANGITIQGPYPTDFGVPFGVSGTTPAYRIRVATRIDLADTEVQLERLMLDTFSAEEAARIGSPTLKLCSDNMGKPGAVIATLSQSGDFWSEVGLRYFCVMPPQRLAPNTSYWLLLEPPEIWEFSIHTWNSGFNKDAVNRHTPLQDVWYQGEDSWRNEWTDYWYRYEPIFRILGKPDIIASKFSYDKNSEQFELQYEIHDGPLENSAHAELKWATGADVRHELPESAVNGPIEINCQDSGSSIYVSTSDILTAPPNATHLLLIIGRHDGIDEVTQANNILAIASPFRKKLVILSPLNGASLSLDKEDGRAVEIPLQVDVNGELDPVIGQIHWDITIVDEGPTVGGKVAWRHQTWHPFEQFAGCGVNQPCLYQIVGNGGRASIIAGGDVDGEWVESDPVTVDIDGYIMNQGLKEQMVSYLKQLDPDYGPLLVGLAQHESKFWRENKGQFGCPDGIVANLACAHKTYYTTVPPKNDRVGGVGLMQINTSPKAWGNFDDMETYWDWKVNADRGRKIFETMLRSEDIVSARINAIKRIRATRARRWSKVRDLPDENTLPELSRLQKENWAMALYLGKGGEDWNYSSPFVYVPAVNRSGSAWEWIFNPGLKNSHVMRYINSAGSEARAILGDDPKLFPDPRVQ